MTYFTRVGLLEDMVHLFGGIRFRHMDLYKVDRMRLLLDACSRTLETLRLYPTCQGEEASPDGTQVVANDFSVVFPPEDIDLSRIRSLRVLELAASSIVGGEPGFIARMLSTITSPAFTEVVVFYRDYDFGGIDHMGGIHTRAFYPMTEAETVWEVSWRRRQFEIIREMHQVRDFRLALRVDVWDRVGGYAVWILRQAVAIEKAEVGFDCLFPEPLLVYTPRRCIYESLEDFTPNTLSPWLRW